jgi:hypothetical protein
MNFPATSAALKASGWEYDNDSECRGCGAAIEWWITPKGKKMPMSVKNESTIHEVKRDVRMPHWSDCPNAGDFRK